MYIPTYNEIENIEAIIKAVFAQSDELHILIVDDNSPDATADKVRELQNIYPNRLFLEVRTEKKRLRNSLYSRLSVGISTRL